MPPGKKKKDKKDEKSANHAESDEAQQSGSKDPPPGAVTPELAAELARRLKLMEASASSSAKDMDEAKQHNYQFWATQPVPKFEENITENTFIEPNLEMSAIRSDPFTLPQPFVWSEVDILNDEQLGELYTLLTENYVEDDENMFRFDYSREFLRWALQPPGWLKKWHVGVRASPAGKLLAFISAIPCHMRVYDKSVQMVEINYLCVHKKLRSKRVAPVLIREITRRVNQEGIFQAAFTAGIVIPKPVGQCRYWHRSLNPKKLIETRFSHLARNMTLARTIKLYKLPEVPQTASLVKMERKHLSSAHKLLTEYLKKFDLVPLFTEAEFEHFMLPRDNVVYTYVVERDDGSVSDLLSFYNLPSTVMNHPTHKVIRAAYAFYNVANTVPIVQLMNDALILARKEDFDVFNALDLMENKQFLEELKFGIGDGNLQYYLYNWKCPDMKPEQVGLVLQ